MEEMIIEEGLKKDINKVANEYYKFVDAVEEAKQKITNEYDEKALEQKMQKVKDYEKVIKDLQKLGDGKEFSRAKQKMIKERLKDFKKELKDLKGDKKFMRILKAIGVGYIWDIFYQLCIGVVIGVIAGLGAPGAFAFTGLGSLAALGGGVYKGAKYYDKKSIDRAKALNKKSTTTKDLTEEVNYFNY